MGVREFAVVFLFSESLVVLDSGVLGFEVPRFLPREFTALDTLIDPVLLVLQTLIDRLLRRRVWARCAILNAVFQTVTTSETMLRIARDQYKLRSAKVRLIRNGIVIYPPADRTASLDSLKRFKEDVREVAQGFECGIKIAGYDDVKVDDVIEAYRVEQVQRKLS